MSLLLITMVDFLLHHTFYSNKITLRSGNSEEETARSVMQDSVRCVQKIIQDMLIKLQGCSVSSTSHFPWFHLF